MLRTYYSPYGEERQARYILIKFLSNHNVYLDLDILMVCVLFYTLYVTFLTNAFHVNR